MIMNSVSDEKVRAKFDIPFMAAGLGEKCVNVVSQVIIPLMFKIRILSLGYEKGSPGLTKEFRLGARLVPLLSVSVVHNLSQSALAASALSIAQATILLKSLATPNSEQRKDALSHFQWGVVVAVMWALERVYREENSVWELPKTTLVAANLTSIVAKSVLNLMNKCGLLPD